MTDKEFYEALKPLEGKMNVYKQTRSGALTSSDVDIIKNVYPKLYELSSGHIRRYFTSSCNSCVIQTFQILISVFDRLKVQFDKPTIQIKTKS